MRHLGLLAAEGLPEANSVSNPHDSNNSRCDRRVDVPDMDTVWTAESRALLSSVLDQLIPESEDGRIPSGGSTGVIEFIEFIEKECERDSNVL